MRAQPPRLTRQSRKVTEPYVVVRNDKDAWHNEWDGCGVDQGPRLGKALEVDKVAQNGEAGMKDGKIVCEVE